VAGLSAGCQDKDDTSSGSQALYAIGSDHDLCLSSNRGRVYTEGLDVIANRGPGPVHIDRAQWVQTSGLKLVAVSVFQHNKGDQFASFGVWNGYPPQGLSRPPGNRTLAAWDRRVPAEGADLPVSGEDEDYFDVVVSLSGATGTAGPIRLTYTDADGKTGTVDTLVKVRLEPECSG
jgi:hypothetical protein